MKPILCIDPGASGRGYRIDPDEFRHWRASGCPGLPRKEAGSV